MDDVACKYKFLDFFFLSLQPVRNIDEDAQRQKPAMETKTVTSICAVEDPVANTAKSVVEQCVTKPRTGGPIPLLESLSNLRNLLSKKSFNEMTVEEADKTHMMPHAASRSHVVSNLRSSDVVVTNKLNNIDDNSVKCNNQTDLSTDSHTVIAANGLSLAVDKYYHLSSVDDVLSQKLKPTASALGLSLNLSNDLICAVQPNRQDDENSEDGPNELGSKQTCSDEETVPGVKKQCHCADNETPVPRLMSSEIILTSKCQIVDDEVEQAGSTVTEESTLQSELRMATESQEVGYLYSPTEECRYKESVEQDRSAKKSCSHDLNGMTSTALFDVNQSECSVAKACLCSKNELTGSSEHVVDFLIASGTRLASDSVETEVHECAKLRTECSDSVSSMIKRDAGADTVESVKNVENDSCERGINYIQIVDDCISERTSHPIATIASSQQLFTNISKQRLESFTMVRNSSCKDPEFSSKSNCNNSEEGAADVASISDEPSSHVMHKTKQPDASGSLRVPVCSNVIPNLHSLRFELKSEEHVPSCEVLQVPIESQSENGFESCVVSEDSVRWKATDVINRTSDCRGLTRSSSAEFSWQLILASKTACPSVRPSEVSVEGTNCCNCNKTAYLSLHCRKAGILDCFVPCLFCQSKRSVGSRFSKNVVLEASDCNKVIVFEKANIQSGAISDSNFIVNYSSSNNSDFTSTSSALVVPSYSSETASNKRSVPLSLPLVQDVCVLDSAGARHSSENDACMPTGWLQDVSLVSNTADQLADTLVNRKSCFSETEAVLYEVTAELDDAVPVSLDVVESECRLLKASVAETCSSDESWCNSNTNGLQGLSGDVASTGHSCSSVETSSHQQNLPMEKSDGQREVSVESEEADLKIEERFVHLDANCNGCSVELLSFGNDNVITDSAEPFELSLSGDANVSDNSRLPKCVEMREKQKADGQNVVPSEDAVETDEKLSCNFVNLSTDPQIDRIIRTLLEPCSSLRTEHAPDYNMPTVHANSLCSETRNVDCCSTVELPEDTCFGPDNRSFLESYIHTDKGSPLPDIGLLSAVLEGACLDQVRPSSVGSQHSCSSSLDSLSFVDKLPEVDSVVDRSTSHDGNAPADTVVNRLAAVLQFDRETKSEAGDAFTIKVDGAVSLCDVMPTCSNPGHHDLFCPSSHTSRAAEFAGASEDHPSNGAVPDAISSLETVCGYDVPSPIRGVGETCSSLFTSDSAGDDCANDVGQPVPAAFRFTSACSAVRLEEARASLSIADVPKQGEKCPRNYIDGADFFNGCVAAVRRTSHCDASSSLPAGSRSTVSPPVAVKCCCGSGSGGSKRHCRTLLRMPEKLLHVDNRSSAAGDRRIPLFSLAAGGSAAARRRKFLAVLMNREGTSRLQRKRGLGAVSGRDDSEDLRKTDAANDEDVNVESCASHPLQCSELDVDRLTNAVSKGVCDSSVSSSSFRGRRSTLEKTYLQAENANLGSTEKPADSRKDTARLSDVQSATNLLSATRQKIRLTASVDEKYRKFEETDVSAGKFQSSVQPVSEQTDCLATSADEDAGGDDSSVNVQKNGGGTFKVQMPVKDEDIDCAIERDETPDCCAIIMHSVTDNWRSNVKHVTDITTDDLKAPPTNALVQIDFSHKENAVDTTRPENGSHDMSDAMCVCNVARAVSSINIDITAVASSPGSERPADGSLCDELCEKSADSEKPSIGIDTIPENAERWVKSAMRQELYSHSKEEKMNKNGSNLDCLTPAKRAGRKRRSLLLKQLANTEGYVADKKGTQNERDNLLVDSTLLDREQRALQVGCQWLLCIRK
jgi:hypothetical protein